jgi:hypothetical protein
VRIYFKNLNEELTVYDKKGFGVGRKVLQR